MPQGCLLNLMRIKREQRVGKVRWVLGEAYLGFGQTESLGQLLSLRSHHVVIPLEGVLQLEQLRR